MITPDATSTDLLFEDLSKYTIDPFSIEKETEMIKLWQEEKNEWAKDQIYRANMRFVIDVAQEYKYGDMSLAELISCGAEGMGVALDRFDTGRNYKFISYAVWWIRQRILHYLRRSGRNIRLPDSRIRDSISISTEREKMTVAMGRFPTDNDLRESLQWTETRYKNAISTNIDTYSLDAPASGHKHDGGLHEVIPDDESQDPLTIVSIDNLNDWIRSRIDLLDPRCRMIITAYFGIGDEEPKTLEEIGDILGVTRERVRQLKERSLIKMKGDLNSSEDVIG